jgi:hypothetical protein
MSGHVSLAQPDQAITLEDIRHLKESNPGRRVEAFGCREGEMDPLSINKT